MKEMLSTTSSIIVILFCCSILFLSEGKGISPEESVQVKNQNIEIQNGFSPPVKATLFTRVQSVRVRKGVLMFSNLEQGKLKEHYFLIRDKNVILTKEPNSDMPHQSIKFEDDGHGAMQVTIPETLEIDLMEELSAH